MKFLDNVWVVTIIGGVAVSIAGYLLDELISRFRNKSKIKKTNMEVVSFLTNLYINKTIVDKSLIEMIKDSYARKNYVKIEKLPNDIQYLGDVLIKIYETQHLSIEDKISIANTIQLYLKNSAINESSEYEEVNIKKSENNRITTTHVDSKGSIFRSVFLLLLSLITVFGILYLQIYPLKFGVKPKIDDDYIVIIMMVVVSVSLSSAASYLNSLTMKKFNSNKKNKKK